MCEGAGDDNCEIVSDLFVGLIVPDWIVSLPDCMSYLQVRFEFCAQAG